MDWAKEVHGVCVLEADGDPLLEQGIAHDERSLDGLCELLVELDVKRVAIERPDGVLWWSVCWERVSWCSLSTPTG
jgi:hypothetical protein